MGLRGRWHARVLAAGAGSMVSQSMRGCCFGERDLSVSRSRDNAVVTGFFAPPFGAPFFSPPFFAPPLGGAAIQRIPAAEPRVEIPPGPLTDFSARGAAAAPGSTRTGAPWEDAGWATVGLAVARARARASGRERWRRCML